TMRSVSSEASVITRCRGTRRSEPAPCQSARGDPKFSEKTKPLRESAVRRRSRFQGGAKLFADPHHFSRVDRDFAGAGAAQLVEERPGFRVIGCVTRHHMAVEVRMTLAQRRRVDTQRAGDLFERALEVPERHTKIRRFAIIEMRWSADMSL